MTTIKLKNGSGAPTAGDLVQGEPALDLTNKRLYTEDSGGTVIEVGTNPGTDVTFANNRKAIFGDSSDLQIFSEGSSGNSFINETGNGSLFINASNLYLRKGEATFENFVACTANGDVKLYYDNAEKLATTATGIDVTGSISADGLTVDASSPDVIVKDTQAHTTSDGPLVQFQGKGPNGTNYNFGYIQGLSNGSNNAGDMVLGTNTAGVQYQRMRLEDNGDISFYEDTGTTAKFFWDASAESLGIGTDSPASGLHVVKGTADVLRLERDATNDWRFQLTVGALTFRDATNDAERMRIDSSGAVLIHPNNATRGLKITSTTTGTAGDTTTYDTIAAGFGRHIFKTDGTERVRIDQSGTAMFKGGTTDNAIQIWESGSEIARIGGSSGTLNFLVGSTTDSRLSIDASGNVGIGTSSPTFTTGSGLEIERAGAATLRLEDTGSGGKPFEIYSDDGEGYVVNGIGSGMPMIFKTVNTERMRIDASGNLLVSKTSDDNSTAGVVLRDTGEGSFVVSEGRSGLFKRLSTDGEIISFRKDTLTVGSIGADNASINIGSGNTGLLFYNTATAIYPRTAAGAQSNGAIDLGGASDRFKDLYLSGDVIAPNIVASNGIFLGGTSIDNRLDDYEEGTCDLTWSDGTNNSTVVTNKYTKVGRIVTVSGYVAGNVSGLTSTAVAKIAGFPFAFSDYGSFAVKLRYIDSPTGCIGIVGDHANSGSVAQLSFIIDNGNYVDVLVSDLSTNSNDTYFNITYTAT
jgi:hypothetical protein